LFPPLTLGSPERIEVSVPTFPLFLLIRPAAGELLLSSNAELRPPPSFPFFAWDVSVMDVVLSSAFFAESCLPCLGPRRSRASVAILFSLEGWQEPFLLQGSSSSFALFFLFSFRFVTRPALFHLTSKSPRSASAP